MRDSIKRQQSNGIAWVDQEAYEQLEEQLAEAQEWKESAIGVMFEWDATWEAMGKPGSLGSSKAVACRAAYEALRTAAERVVKSLKEECVHDYSDEPESDVWLVDGHVEGVKALAAALSADTGQPPYPFEGKCLCVKPGHRPFNPECDAHNSWVIGMQERDGQPEAEVCRWTRQGHRMKSSCGMTCPAERGVPVVCLLCRKPIRVEQGDGEQDHRQISDDDPWVTVFGKPYDGPEQGDGEQESEWVEIRHGNFKFPVPRSYLSATSALHADRDHWKKKADAMEAEREAQLEAVRETPAMRGNDG